VRICTHEIFRQFVTSHGIGFHPIAGDPVQLMAFMVNHPRMVTWKPEEIARQYAHLKEIVFSCWDACTKNEGSDVPYLPDVLISNPPATAHVHIAEKLQIPVQIHFTMPWSPTKHFAHPMRTYGKTIYRNKASFYVLEELLWLGAGDIINDFRRDILHLEPISLGGARVRKMKVPHIYCMSPSLVPRPTDWKDHLRIVGFWFMDNDLSYTPPPALASFLAAPGPPIFYIGFGSIVAPNPQALTKTIFDAVVAAGVRAIVGSGWCNLGGLDVPDCVHVIDQCPHEWLFPQCAAVVHHGGAGTTACGLRHGKPTVIVPFFGDQPFWGKTVFKAGVGPKPIPAGKLTVEGLRCALQFCLKEETKTAGMALGERIRAENGVEEAVKAFHEFLPLTDKGEWVVTTVEHQQWSFQTKTWAPSPHAWSSVSGRMQRPKEGFQAPLGWKWQQDWGTLSTTGCTDQDGWQYRRVFGGGWSDHPCKDCIVRRREWYKCRTWSGEETAPQSSPQAAPIANLDSFFDEARPVQERGDKVLCLKSPRG
jgi:UDP:flavonoid glycosyltransferase YjiC (YdhE family)